MKGYIEMFNKRKKKEKEVSLYWKRYLVTGLEDGWIKYSRKTWKDYLRFKKELEELNGR
jgi:hypothetical protein